MLIGALVALPLFVIVIVLCFRRRKAAATERARKFVDDPLSQHDRIGSPGEASEARHVGKLGTPFHRVMHPRRKGALRATPLRAGENYKPKPKQARAILQKAGRDGTRGADTNTGAQEAQRLLEEENQALRMRIREMETLPNVHWSVGHAGVPESDAPPDYDEAAIAL